MILYDIVNVGGISFIFIKNYLKFFGNKLVILRRFFRLLGCYLVEYVRSLEF